MAINAENLKLRSDNIKAAILQLAFELKKINDEAIACQQAHDNEVANLKARHDAELARLIADNEDMTELVETNSTFISAVENLLNA